MIKGQSFTIGIIFDAGYAKERIQSLELNIGEKIVGKLSDNTISLEDDIYICRLTSQQTSFLPSGNIPVTVHLQDSILGVRKSLVGTLEISTSKSKTTSEKSNELVDYFIHISIDDEQITIYAILQTMYRGLPGVTPHIGENGNWFIGDTDTGVKAEGIQGPQGPQGPAGNFFQGQYNLIINKQDAKWVDGWLWIDTGAKTNLKIIEVGYMGISTGKGTEQLKPIVHYPTAPANNDGNNIPNGFYVRDADGFLTENADFEHLDIRYNIKTDTVLKYDGLTQLENGGFVLEEIPGQEYHSKYGIFAFDAAYPEYTGVKLETIKDELSDFGELYPWFTPVYCRERKVNLISKPYVNAATTEQVGSNPDILTVAAHWGNTFERKDITANATTFLKNVIAIGSCPATGTPDSLATSYGFGMEFAEEGNNLGLNAAYPDQTFKHVIGWGTVSGTTYTDDLNTRDYGNVLNVQVGGKIYIGLDVDNLQERIIASINGYVIEVTEAFDPLSTGTNYLYIDAQIGTAWQATADNQKYYQSPVCSIVAAKFRKIQDLSGANWHICRMAARATASNGGTWDMYRGFGVIDVDAAIQWIKDNYTENEDYLNQLADDVERTRGIDQMLSYDNITQNTPVTKKMLEERLQQFFDQINL